MDIHFWKQDKRDKMTICDIPSYKAVSIFELQGGKVIATVQRQGIIEYWSVQIEESKIEPLLKSLRELKQKGMRFDGDDTEIN